MLTMRYGLGADWHAGCVSPGRTVEKRSPSNPGKESIHMKPSLISGRNAMMAGLLGAAILMAAPATSSAQQEKWWTPREGGRERVQRNVTRREQARVPRWDRGMRR